MTYLSVGVILFILLNGYPPFEYAHKNDKWFKPLIKNNYDKFWKAHKKSAAFKDQNARGLYLYIHPIYRYYKITFNIFNIDLLQKMLTFDPNERITIDEIKNHPWFTDEILEHYNLMKHLQNNYKKAEIIRKKISKNSE